MRQAIVILAAILSFLLAGESALAEKVNVVVSIYPLRDIVRQVGGDMVNVDFIVPAGASPHTFEPTPSDMKKISSAKIFVIIGAGFEFWAEKAVRSAGRKDMKVIVMSKGLPLIKDPSGHGHQGDAADPHIWLDPIFALEMVDRIALALIELDSHNKEHYLKRTEDFKRELKALHARVNDSVKTFKIKEYVTFHSAWNYFSRRYGLKVSGVIEESPGKEASPKHIAKIVRRLKEINSKIVFAEPQFNPKIADVIAKEAGAKVLFLDPIGSPDIKGRDTYIGLMDYNLSVLEKAMK